MIEVKKESVKVSGDKRIIKAEFTMLVYALVDSGQFSKEEIEESVKRGFMTDKELVKAVENHKAELADMLREKLGGERKETGDKTDDEIKKAIDTIVAKFMERM